VRGGPELYFLSSTRNDLRVPVYSRLDVRANRTFAWGATRLTIFAEALNLYARDECARQQPWHQRHHPSGVRAVRFDVPVYSVRGIVFEF
jgi:hypothetical protein